MGWYSSQEGANEPQADPQCEQPGVLSCYAARSLGESSRRGNAALLEIAGTSTCDSTAGKFPVASRDYSTRAVYLLTVPKAQQCVRTAENIVACAYYTEVRGDDNMRFMLAR